MGWPGGRDRILASPWAETDMRILSIGQNYYVAGGMDRVMFDQARILTERGHEVVPFTAADTADESSEWAVHFPTAARTDATTLAELPKVLWRPGAARALRNLMAAEAFDIVHIHSWYKRLSPAILPVLRDAGVPVVQTLHDYRTVCSRSTMVREGVICRECAGGKNLPALRYRCNGSLAKTLASVAEMKIADLAGYREIVRRFLPVSTFQRDLLQQMGVPEEQMCTLPNPVAIPDRTAPPPMANAPVLFAGRLESYKGAHIFAALARLRPDTAFVMAGDGSERAAIAADAPANLRMLGQLDQDALAIEIAKAACVVVPSFAPETFGLSAAEALVAGRPVVASRIGGLIEIVRDGHDGLLVEPGDVSGFAAAVDHIIADPERARMMGMAGRARIASLFSEDRYCDRVMEIYHEVLKEAS